MKRLIINADDLGINSARSHGILAAAEEGIVTSMSLIATGGHAVQAARRAAERNLSVGLHLSLTEGSPISKQADIETLLHVDGAFRDRDTLRRLLDAGEIDKTHVEREIRAQVEWMLDHCGQPTHVDGHHHIHVHPFIVPLLIPVMDRYGIRFVRIPSEPLPPFGWEMEPTRVEPSKRISRLADEARPLFAANGIGSTDHFRGLAMVGSASKKVLRHILSKLPEGSTELMVHPGSMCTEGTDFDRDPQRQTEFQMLTDEEMRGFMKGYGIELCSFQDL